MNGCGRTTRRRTGPLCSDGPTFVRHCRHRRRCYLSFTTICAWCSFLGAELVRVLFHGFPSLSLSLSLSRSPLLGQSCVSTAPSVPLKFPARFSPADVRYVIFSSFTPTSPKLEAGVPGEQFEEKEVRAPITKKWRAKKSQKRRLRGCSEERFSRTQVRYKGF